jgi:hypothetical protein
MRRWRQFCYEQMLAETMLTQERPHTIACLNKLKGDYSGLSALRLWPICAVKPRKNQPRNGVLVS